MPAASTSMAQRWSAFLYFNQYCMNGGLALPTGAAALFQKPLLLVGPYRGRGPGGPTPAPRPGPGGPRAAPMVGPHLSAAPPRKTRRAWSRGPPSGPHGAAAAAQRRPSAGRVRPQSPRCADRLHTCGNEMTVRGGAGAEKYLLIDGVFTGQDL